MLFRSGVAMIITVLTDNKNRAISEIKHLLSTHGAVFAAVGAASWAFEKTPDGLVAKTTIDLSEKDVEKLADLIDVLEEHDDVQEVVTNAV